jgi:hypothetical protein
LDAFALADEEEEPTSYPLTPEDIASLGRGFADADAGRGRDGHEFLAELRQKWGRLPRTGRP